MNNANAKGKRNEIGGFTIVELLVVIVLIALIAGVSGGFSLLSVKNRKLEKVVNDLSMACRYARIMAIERQKEYRLCLDKREGVFWVEVDMVNKEVGEIQAVVVKDSYCKPGELPGGVVFEDVDVDDAEDNRWANSGGDSAEIEFRPDGSATEAVIVVGNGKKRYWLSVNAATGKVKVVRRKKVPKF